MTPEEAEKAKSNLTTAQKVARFTGGKPVGTGPDLIKALKISGTPDSKLAVAREALKKAWDEEKRVLDADDLIFAMEKAGMSPATLDKARTLNQSGVLRGPSHDPPIEDQIVEQAAAAAAADKKKAVAK